MRNPQVREVVDFISEILPRGKYKQRCSSCRRIAKSPFYRLEGGLSQGVGSNVMLYFDERRLALYLVATEREKRSWRQRRRRVVAEIRKRFPNLEDVTLFFEGEKCPEYLLEAAKQRLAGRI